MASSSAYSRSSPATASFMLAMRLFSASQFSLHGRLAAQGIAGQNPVGMAVVGGEPAVAGETPSVGHRGDCLAVRVGREEVAVRVFETDAAQVGGGGAAEVTAERQLQGADGHAGGSGDVGRGDVAVGVVVDEADGAAQGRGVGVAAVFGGGLGQGIVREDGQRGRGEQPCDGAGYQGRSSGCVVQLVTDEAVNPEPEPRMFWCGWLIAGEPDRPRQAAGAPGAVGDLGEKVQGEGGEV